MRALVLSGLLLASCDDTPPPVKLPVPDVSPPAAAPSPPPPPPPPPLPSPTEPPAALRAYVQARAHRQEPWQVTLVDLATTRRAALSAADAAALVALLSSRDAWLDSAYGCTSTGLDLRLARGPGAPLVLWTSCGNVKVDGATAAFSEPIVRRIRELAGAHGLDAP